MTKKIITTPPLGVRCEEGVGSGGFGATERIKCIMTIQFKNYTNEKWGGSFEPPRLDLSPAIGPLLSLTFHA